MQLRLTALAALLVSLACGARASAQSAGAPPPEFGKPPSGQIPIIFSPLDQHVYAKPDKLERNRLLAALVKNGTVLVPLRSLFEQLGATVSYQPSSRTVDVAKSGTDVQLTLGKRTITLNGEVRPLDVGPEIYRGVMVVPVRVISEALGAYVLWVPDQRLVVVRYLPPPSPTPAPTAPPTPPPTAPPSLPPTPPPTPSPTPAPSYERFIAGDYLFTPKIYNELSPGNSGKNAFDAKAAAEFPAFGATFMLQGDYRRWQYSHNSNIGLGGCLPTTPACTTVIGTSPIYFQPGACPAPDPGCVTVVGYSLTQAFNGLGQAYVPAFTATESDFDAHLGFKVIDPRVYIGVGGFFKNYSYLGYPNLAGAGFGLTKLPDLDQTLSYYADVWYYPNVSGTYTFPSTALLGPLSGATAPLSYAVLTYDVGLTYTLAKTGLFLEAGYVGERSSAKSNAPSDTSLGSASVGLGFHF